MTNIYVIEDDSQDVTSDIWIAFFTRSSIDQGTGGVEPPRSTINQAGNNRGVADPRIGGIEDNDIETLFRTSTVFGF